jgi:hypothetical protein
VRIFRRVESGVGRALLALVAFLLATLVVGTVIGIANSNIFWGEDDQYGRVEVPGHAVLRLPSGSVQISAAAALPGRGNQTPEFLVPDIGLSVVPVGGGAPAEVRRDAGHSRNADDDEVDTQRRIGYLDVPRAGSYRVVTTGDFNGYGIDGQLWFGHEPGLITGIAIWLVAAGVVLLLAGIAIGISILRSRRSGEGGSGGAVWATLDDSVAADRSRSLAPASRR